jgi:hypothetical protein
MARWSIEREGGWPIYVCTADDGRIAKSYPKPRWWAVPLYPWFVWKAIRAIKDALYVNPPLVVDGVRVKPITRHEPDATMPDVPDA